MLILYKWKIKKKKEKKASPAAVQTNLLDISVCLETFDRKFCLRSAEISTSWPPADLCVYRNGTVGRRGRILLSAFSNVTASPRHTGKLKRAGQRGRWGGERDGAGESAVSVCISDARVYPVSGSVPAHHWHACALVSVCVCERERQGERVCYAEMNEPNDIYISKSL